MKKFFRFALPRFVLIFTIVFGTGCDCGLYNEDEYTIEFDTQGGSEIASINYNWGDALVIPQNPTKEGYTFDGWYYENGNKITLDGFTVETNLKLVAHWKINSYKVTFNTNGGTFTDSTTTYEVTSNYNTQVTAGTPIKSGYRFTGWYLDSDCTNEFNGKVPSRNITVYAKYSLNKLTVNFAPGFSTTTYMQIQIITNGVATALNSNIFTRYGYIFDNWKDEDGNVYTNNQVISVVPEQKSITLTAQWTPDTFKTNLILNSVSIGEISTLYNEEIDYSSFTDPTKTGYQFAGWGVMHLVTSTEQYFDTYEYFKKNDDGFFETYNITNFNAIPDGTVYVVDTLGKPTVCTGDTDVYAKFVKGKFNLSFVYNYLENDKAKVVTTEVSYNSTYLLPDAGNNDGYTFAGWYKDQALTDPVNTSQTQVMGAANLTLYAKWTPVSYTVVFSKTFPAADGYIPERNSNYDVVETIPANSFTYTGHTFVKWNTLADGTGTDYNPGDTVTHLHSNAGAVITFFAIWSENKYTVSFDANTGSGEMSDLTEVLYSDKYNLTANTFTKDGYTFIKWNTLANGEGTSFNNNQEVSSLVEENNGNIKLYAIWQANSYIVSFDSNGGDGSIDNINAYYDQDITIAANAFTKTGYHFVKWNTSSDGSGTDYTENAIVNNLSSVNGDAITLFAIWSENKYSISFDANTGLGEMSALSNKLYSEDITLTANAFTKACHSFVKWNTSSDGTGTDYSDSEVVSKLCLNDNDNITLYAVWSINQYTVTFVDYDNQDTIDSANVDYDTLILSINVELDKLGYNYELYIDSELMDDEAKVSSDTTVKVKYTALPLSIQFYGYNADSIETTINTEETLPVKAKDGYTFKGWSLSQDGSGTLYSKYTITDGNTVMLYPVFDVHTYTVNYIANFPNQSPSTSGTMTNGTLDYNDKLAKNTFSCVGYIFNGWVDGSQNDVADEALLKDLHLDNEAILNLTAKWTAISYKVVFNANTASGSINDINASYAENITIPANSFTKTGFHFVKWNTSSDGTGTDYAENASVSKLTDSNNSTITLYAIWSENKYTIHFDANTASESMDSLSNKLYSENVTLTANTFTKTGYVFNGWNTIADGTGTAYTDGQVVSQLCSNDNDSIILYAQWSVTHYTIKFNANTGLGNIANIDAVYDVNQTIPANAFTKTGYHFVKFNTKEDGTGTSYNPNDVVSKLVTDGSTVNLYAIWEINTHTVTFTYHGGNQEYTRDYQEVYTAPQVSSNYFDGALEYVFLGWTLNGTDLVSVSDVYNNDTAVSNVTFTAKYSSRNYTVKYLNKLNGSVIYETVSTGSFSDYISSLYVFYTQKAIYEDIITRLSGIQASQNATLDLQTIGYYCQSGAITDSAAIADCMAFIVAAQTSAADQTVKLQAAIEECNNAVTRANLYVTYKNNGYVPSKDDYAFNSWDTAYSTFDVNTPTTVYKFAKWDKKVEWNIDSSVNSYINGNNVTFEWDEPTDADSYKVTLSASASNNLTSDDLNDTEIANLRAGNAVVVVLSNPSIIIKGFVKDVTLSISIVVIHKNADDNGLSVLVESQSIETGATEDDKVSNSAIRINLNSTPISLNYVHAITAEVTVDAAGDYIYWSEDNFYTFAGISIPLDFGANELQKTGVGDDLYDIVTFEVSSVTHYGIQVKNTTGNIKVHMVSNDTDYIGQILPLVSKGQFTFSNNIEEYYKNTVSSNLTSTFKASSADAFKVGVASNNINYLYIDNQYGLDSGFCVENDGTYYNGFSFGTKVKTSSGWKNAPIVQVEYRFVDYNNENSIILSSDDDNIMFKYDSVHDVFYFKEAAYGTKWIVTVSFKNSDNNYTIPKYYKNNFESSFVSQQLVIEINAGLNVCTYSALEKALADLSATNKSLVSASDYATVVNLQANIQTIEKGNSVLVGTSEVSTYIIPGNRLIYAMSNIGKQNALTKNNTDYYGELDIVDNTAIMTASGYKIFRVATGSETPLFHDKNGVGYVYDEANGTHSILQANFITNYSKGKFKLNGINYCKDTYYNAGGAYSRGLRNCSPLQRLYTSASNDYSVVPLVLEGNYFTIDASNTPYIESDASVQKDGEGSNAKGYKVQSHICAIYITNVYAESEFNNLVLLGNNVDATTYYTKNTIDNDEAAQYIYATSGSLNGIHTYPFRQHRNYATHGGNVNVETNNKCQQTLNHCSINYTLIPIYADDESIANISYCTINKSWADSMYGVGGLFNVNNSYIGPSGGPTVCLDESYFINSGYRYLASDGYKYAEGSLVSNKLSYFVYSTLKDTLFKDDKSADLTTIVDKLKEYYSIYNNPQNTDHSWSNPSIDGITQVQYEEYVANKDVYDFILTSIIPDPSTQTVNPDAFKVAMICAYFKLFDSFIASDSVYASAITTLLSDQLPDASQYPTQRAAAIAQISSVVGSLSSITDNLHINSTITYDVSALNHVDTENLTIGLEPWYSAYDLTAGIGTMKVTINNNITTINGLLGSNYQLFKPGTEAINIIYLGKNYFIYDTITDTDDRHAAKYDTMPVLDIVGANYVQWLGIDQAHPTATTSWSAQSIFIVDANEAYLQFVIKGADLGVSYDMVCMVRLYGAQ